MTDVNVTETEAQAAAPIVLADLSADQVAAVKGGVQPGGHKVPDIRNPPPPPRRPSGQQ